MEIEDDRIIILVISKEWIANFDFTEILGGLLSMHKTPKKFYNRLNLAIDGYDNDAREIYEIEEIRKYLDFLDKTFPYWFYYLEVDSPKQYSSFSILYTCVCKIQRVVNEEPKRVEFDIDSLSKFILEHFGFMNELMDKEGHSEDEIRIRSNKIIDLIR